MTSMQGRRAAQMPPTDWRVWQEAQVATEFVSERRATILGAEEQLQTLVQLLPAPPVEPETPWILDIGCGDGILLDTVLQQWTRGRGVALDGSPTMLEHAANRFVRYPPGTVTLVSADFNEFGWTEALPHRAFHAIVSGFAIHHSEDAIKQRLYAQIYALLASGGVFVHIEHVASASAWGEALFERAYAHFLWNQRRERGESVAFEDVLREFQARLDKSANRLTPVETQLTWLRELGFTHVDCYWKRYELAVFAGYKDGT